MNKIEEAAQLYLEQIIESGKLRAVPRDDFIAGAKWLYAQINLICNRLGLADPPDPDLGEVMVELKALIEG